MRVVREKVWVTREQVWVAREKDRLEKKEIVLVCHHNVLLPTGSEERGVLGVGSVPVAILPSCQDVINIALFLS